ncbi:PD-(D/E)XK motif protein [Variovorax sp. LT1R16]|uniref:PD-(D/E)XK motif protein n=1 Tax=Variovorax sp. LT1R16 TaxID=3443728 RepID=UPI003F46E5B6
MDLLAEFQQLHCATSDIDFSATPISTRRKDFLAKGVDGAPVFLLQDASPAQYTPGVALRHLSVQFHASCRVITGHTTVEDQFAVLACDASVPELHELFIRSVGAVIDQLPVTAETRDLESCVRGLLNLFRSLSAPGSREIAGLWAELFVIARSGDVAAAVRAWHADVFERFDFSWSDAVLEVKATHGPSRVHEFALEQLDAPTKESGNVASLMLQPMTNGVGILDLANEIDTALTDAAPLRERLWANIASALGSDFGSKLDRRFDTAFAERNLIIYSMSDIPCPSRPSDARISAIRFRVDLSTANSSSPTPKFRGLQDLFRR